MGIEPTASSMRMRRSTDELPALLAITLLEVNFLDKIIFDQSIMVRTDLVILHRTQSDEKRKYAGIKIWNQSIWPK